MLVDLGDAPGEVVHQVVDGVGQGDLDQGVIGKDAGDLPAERFVHAVVVVRVQEPSLLEVAAQVAQLLVREVHVAVSRHVEIRNVPQLGAAQRHGAVTVGDAQRRALAQGREQVGERGRVRVAVAAAVVVEAADGEKGGTRNAEVGTRNRMARDCSAFRVPRFAFMPPGEPERGEAQEYSQELHNSFTNRYAVFREIPVSSASCSATSLRVSPWASSARARSSASGGGSGALAFPVPATMTVTSPRAGASA